MVLYVNCNQGCALLADHPSNDVLYMMKSPPTVYQLVMVSRGKGGPRLTLHLATGLCDMLLIIIYGNYKTGACDIPQFILGALTARRM
jgi:hypothetical protein